MNVALNLLIIASLAL